MLAGLFMPASITGSIGWALAMLGLGGSGRGRRGKVMLERSNARRLEAAQKQLVTLKSQVEQSKADRDAWMPNCRAAAGHWSAGCRRRKGTGRIGGDCAVGRPADRGPARMRGADAAWVRRKRR